MRKEEYLQKLEQLLYGIPAEDREEALHFYRDYLEDAGDNAGEVLRSLGTPEELAKSIQKDLYGDNEAGDFTRSNRDVPETWRAPFSTGGRYSQNTGTEYTYNEKNVTKSSGKGKLSAGQWIIFIILCLCAAPIIIPICGTIISVIIALIIAVIAIVFGVGIAGIALVIAAIAIIIAALVKLVVSPFSALIMVGGGLLMVGLGLIGIVFAIWLVFKVLPKMCTGIADICSKLFNK